MKKIKVNIWKFHQHCLREAVATSRESRVVDWNVWEVTDEIIFSVFKYRKTSDERKNEGAELIGCATNVIFDNFCASVSYLVHNPYTVFSSALTKASSSLEHVDCVNSKHKSRGGSCTVITLDVVSVNPNHGRPVRQNQSKQSKPNFHTLPRIFKRRHQVTDVTDCCWSFC